MDPGRYPGFFEVNSKILIDLNGVMFHPIMSLFQIFVALEQFITLIFSQLQLLAKILKLIVNDKVKQEKFEVINL